MSSDRGAPLGGRRRAWRSAPASAPPAAASDGSSAPPESGAPSQTAPPAPVEENGKGPTISHSGGSAPRFCPSSHPRTSRVAARIICGVHLYEPAEHHCDVHGRVGGRCSLARRHRLINELLNPHLITRIKRRQQKPRRRCSLTPEPAPRPNRRHTQGR